jgi:hypothetical protein
MEFGGVLKCHPEGQAFIAASKVYNLPYFLQFSGLPS